MIQFFMEHSDLKLGLKIDHVVFFCPIPIFFFLAILTHHDHRGLERCNTGKNKV
jgi:hypothetical protein